MTPKRKLPYPYVQTQGELHNLMTHDYSKKGRSKAKPHTEVRVKQRKKARMNSGQASAELLVKPIRKARRHRDIARNEIMKQAELAQARAQHIASEVVASLAHLFQPQVNEAPALKAEPTRKQRRTTGKRVGSRKQTVGIEVAVETVKLTKGERRAKAEIQAGEEALAKAMGRKSKAKAVPAPVVTPKPRKPRAKRNHILLAGTRMIHEPHGTGTWVEVPLSQAGKELAKRRYRTPDKVSIPLAKPLPNKAAKPIVSKRTEPIAKPVIIEAKTTKRGPNHIHCIESQNTSGGTHTYLVQVPKDWKFTDFDLITRCDNATWDTDKPRGDKRHFGGHVTRQKQAGVYKVEVSVD